MRFASAALLLVSAVAAVHGSDVHDLDDKTFDVFFKSDNTKPVLLEFYAPWCGHCKALAPKYEEAATILKDHDIRLAKVNCDANTELCAKYDIGGYPTLKVVLDNNVKDAKLYSGQRTSEGIVGYMQNQGKDMVQPLTAEALAEAKSKSTVFVAFYNEDDKSTAQAFKDAANEFKEEEYIFTAISDLEVAAAEGIKVPSVIAYKPLDEPTTFDGELNAAKLTAFIKISGPELFGEIGPKTYASYSTAGIPLGFVFVEQPADEKLLDSLKLVAKKFRGKVNIATIDAGQYGAYAASVNLKIDADNKAEWPAFSIQDFSTDKKYAFDQSKEFTVEAIEKFVSAFVAGEVEPTVKSEPIPDEETQLATDVTILVAKTFQELVINNDKDVLVEFYAPWCGHCKTLAPKYEELATNYKPFSSKIVIAKIDATANDVPEAIQGFPTIKLYPAGKKEVSVNYQGDRSPEDLAKFVAAEGTYHIDAYVTPEPETEDEEELKVEEVDEPKVADSDKADSVLAADEEILELKDEL